MPDQASHTLSVQNIGFRFASGSWGVRDITIEFPPGSIVVLSGPNGAGKTLLCRLIVALLTPSEGSVALDGEKIEIAKPAAVRRLRSIVGYVQQNADAQFLGETVASDVALGPRNSGATSHEIDRRTREALDTVALGRFADRDPFTLSGGERRRLAIAGMLAITGGVLILDEPFSNLDFRAIKSVLDTILRLRSSGTTVIVVTHELEKIAAHADTMIVLNDGRLIGAGTPLDLAPHWSSWGLRPADRPISEMTWIR